MTGEGGGRGKASGSQRWHGRRETVISGCHRSVRGARGAGCRWRREGGTVHVQASLKLQLQSGMRDAQVVAEAGHC